MVSGRLYDNLGNIRQWWDNATISKFEHKAQCIEKQYSSYVLEQINMQINGKSTKGENIADNGGLKQAYRCVWKGDWKLWELKNHSVPDNLKIQLGKPHFLDEGWFLWKSNVFRFKEYVQNGYIDLETPVSKISRKFKKPAQRPWY